MKVTTLVLLALASVALACDCTYGDYDLSGMTVKNGNYYSIMSNGVYYELNICGPVNNPDCESIPEPAACQRINGPYYALGSATQQKVGPLSTSLLFLFFFLIPHSDIDTFPFQHKGGYGASVTYGGGLACQGGPRVTNINVYCDIYAGKGKILSVVEDPICVYNFNMTSIYACPVFNPTPSFEQL